MSSPCCRRCDDGSPTGPSCAPVAGASNPTSLRAPTARLRRRRRGYPQTGIDPHDGGEAMRRPIRVVGAGMLALGLLAASCGGGDDSDQTTAATSDQGVKSGAQSQLGGEATSSTSGAPSALPTSMEQWEALWADQREEIVDQIQSNNWGVSDDGKTLTGPEGFTIDLSKC